MSKRKKTLKEIVGDMEEAHKDIGKLPTFVLRLPCGCTRKADDPPFVIEEEDGVWNHYVKKTPGHRLKV